MSALDTSNTLASGSGETGPATTTASQVPSEAMTRPKKDDAPPRAPLAAIDPKARARFGLFINLAVVVVAVVMGLAVTAFIGDSVAAASSLDLHDKVFISAGLNIIAVVVVMAGAVSMGAALRRFRERTSAADVATDGDLYDLVFDVDEGFRHFVQHGWAVRAPTRRPEIVRALLERAGVPAVGAAGAGLRRGKIVAFVGRFGAGKTFALNGLYRTHFASGSLQHTKGVSLKWLDDSQMVLLDTNGGLMPVSVGSDEALADRRMTEMFTQELVLAMADHVVVVVNELTSNDQEYIDALARKMSQSKRTDLFVLHNFANAADLAEVDTLWQRRVEQPYSSVGHAERFEEDDDGAARGRSASAADAQRYFMSQSHGVRVCHMRLGREGTPAGAALNARTYRMLRAKLQALVPSRAFDPCTAVDDYARRAFPSYLDGPVDLAWRAVGAFAGDEVSGADPDVVCRLCNVPPLPTSKAIAAAKRADMLAASSSSSSAMSSLAASGLNLRMKLTYAHMGIGVGVAAPDFEAPIDVVDHGDRLVVHIDAPGIDKITAKVRTPPGDAEQFVEVVGRRDRDHHMGRPDSVSLLGQLAAVPLPDLDPDAISTRTAQLVWPTPQPRRFGNLYAKIAMPPGSRFDRASLTMDMGVVRFVIQRQTDDVEATASVPARD
ncbi:RecA-like NTPases incomplete domain containing protein [Pandoravirus macleodensis]|uniref:RecA-like NTPases incomplete domain containing protein n=1 Tax=Pandoravirus macleodensis TaxID=2107707 RepID=A0A2U7UG16_9VIRU|nr:RecA-like NTPases incomplete domain containing protein [Pandoravirus macleodensis]AVK77406.1 RecA-like NTPases incomplete domain containing protein [Pandoravirus macleodensis]